MNRPIFEVFQHLVPRSRAWIIQRVLASAPQLNEFFEGLSDMPADARSFADDLIEDNYPETTDQLDEWEEQFNLIDVGLNEVARRIRLAATWATLGGQSPRYLQDVVTANGFTDVFIHEWWELPVVGVPVVRDPRVYLTDGGPQLIVLCGEPLALCGEPTAVAGETNDPLGYPLVNKIRTTTTVFIGAGDPEMVASDQLPDTVPVTKIFAGEPLTFLQGLVEHPIPDDAALWPYFLYFGGASFPDQGSVPTERRDEFEDLLLTLCPGQQWLGILIDYV